MIKKEELKYITPKDPNAPILGTLEGPCADIINPTRNDRGYGEEVWTKVFNDDIVKEYFEAGGIFGELGHPADRTETDMEKIAICMPEPPKKGKDGLLIGRWDILNTPNGRILKTLVDYGYKVGISSRGSGETYTDDNGNEAVDPDSYEFSAFDIVLLPAVKAARLKPVNEELSKSKKSLRQALTEELNKAKEDEKKIMEETLNNLNIKLESATTDEPYEIWIVRDSLGDYQGDHSNEKDAIEAAKQIENGYVEYCKWDKEKNFDSGQDANTCTTIFTNKDYSPEKVNNIDNLTEQGSDEINEAKNNGSEDLIKSLQEALLAKAQAEAKVLELQNKLAVSDTKVTKLNEEIVKVKQLQTKVDTTAISNEKLKERILVLENEVKDKTAIVETQATRIKTLKEAKERSLNSGKVLNESIKTKDDSIKKLTEKLNDQESNLNAKIKALNEDLETLKNNSNLKIKELIQKVTKITNLAEQYKKISTVTVSRYIKSKALMIGVTPEEIKNRLSESYTIDDIDKICESLQDYRLNVSKLPFNINKGTKIRMTESKNDILQSVSANADDDIDESLLSLVNSGRK